MSKNETKAAKKAAKMPEFLRKLFVSLKRRPSIIALLVLAVGFLLYSLNLTQISNTTAKIQGAGMGLCGFATMLFSMLSLVCALNAYPRRKKPVIPMLILAVLMLGLVVFCDVQYRDIIFKAYSREVDPIIIDASTIYIKHAYDMLMTHIVIEIIGTALLLLVPLYSKLLGKINTSVTVEDYGKLDAIDISGED